MKYTIEKLANELSIPSSELAKFCNECSITGIKKTSEISQELYEKIRSLYSSKSIKARRPSKKISEFPFGDGKILTNISYPTANNNYRDQLLGVLNQYCQCYGYEIIWCDFVSLNIPKYQILGQKEILEPFNMVEKTIFDLIDARVIDPVNVDSISNFLELNKLIVKYYVDGFLASGMLTDLLYTGSLSFSPSGLRAYKNGYKLHTIDPININIYCFNNHYYLLDSNIYNAPTEFRSIDISDTSLQDNSTDDIITLLKQEKIFDQYNYSINTIKANGTLSMPYCIIYLYDFLSDTPSQIVYDIYNGTLISEKDFAATAISNAAVLNDLKYLNRIESVRTLIQAEKLKPSLIDAYEIIRENKDNSTNIERYYDSVIIRKKFLDCFKNASQSVIIQCPWIKGGAIDERFLDAVQEAVNRKVIVFIQYGIDSSIQNETSSDFSIDMLKSITDKDGIHRVFVIWLGNNHTKEVIVDKKIDLFGSFNFLSFNPNIAYYGNSIIREEGMEIITDAKITNQAWQKYTANLENYFLSNLSSTTLCDACALYSLTQTAKLTSAITNFAKFCSIDDFENLTRYCVKYNLNNQGLFTAILNRIDSDKYDISILCADFILKCSEFSIYKPIIIKSKRLKDIVARKKNS